jgi:hypothetical protein
VPHLSCRACGRQIYTTSPLASLFPEERRCPRCGALLFDERRVDERRSDNRRQNPPDNPGPPASPKARGRRKTALDPGTGERRAADRRTARRRGRGGSTGG